MQRTSAALIWTLIGKSNNLKSLVAQILFKVNLTELQTETARRNHQTPVDKSQEANSTFSFWERLASDASFAASLRLVLKAGGRSVPHQIAQGVSFRSVTD